MDWNICHVLFGRFRGFFGGAVSQDLVDGRLCLKSVDIYVAHELARDYGRLTCPTSV